MASLDHHTEKPSDIPLRLVSPQPDLDFLGRLEVFHNDTWGTVCDDNFGQTEVNIVCQMLNFTKGALCYTRYAVFGQGEGMYIALYILASIHACMIYVYSIRCQKFNMNYGLRDQF